jgi:glycosyltransferase involved in cell wall biosynthesis
LVVVHVNANDLIYGADRAVYRIHRSLLRPGLESPIQSSMRVIHKTGDDPSVHGGPPHGVNVLASKILRRFSRFDSTARRPGNPSLHSIAWPSTGLGRELQRRYRQGSMDLVHLHWLGDSTLSIEEVGALSMSMPLVWTFHDQWAFCGAEHYTSPPQPGEALSRDDRYARAYGPESRPPQEPGTDLNRRTWLRKRRSWRRPIPIVCPSTWMASCVRRSSLMGGWPIRVIPHPIDGAVWAPLDQAQARDLLGLPRERPLVLFGAMGGSADPRKGGDLLRDALLLLRARVQGTALDSLNVVVFGQSCPAAPPDLGFPVHYMGRLYDDISLRLVYAAADVMVVPSRQEAFGQTATESHACGTPVVAFRTGGLTDIVDDRLTGVLAEPFQSASLASAIHWVLEDPTRRRQLAAAARERAERLWDPTRIATLYASLYAETTERFASLSVKP